MVTANLVAPSNRCTKTSKKNNKWVLKMLLFHKGKCIIVDIFKEMFIKHFMEEGLCVSAFSPHFFHQFGLASSHPLTSSAPIAQMDGFDIVRI